MQVLIGEPAVERSFEHFGVDLLLERSDADHEILVEVGAVDRDELQTLQKRVALVDRFFEDAIVELQPRKFAAVVQRRIVRAGSAARPASLSVRLQFLGFNRHGAALRRPCVEI